MISLQETKIEKTFSDNLQIMEDGLTLMRELLEIKDREVFNKLYIRWNKERFFNIVKDEIVAIVDGNKWELDTWLGKYQFLNYKDNVAVDLPTALWDTFRKADHVRIAHKICI